ncbi:hypothetical protein AX16_005465 [Volvariella volvacea WC 439]|nr:hypothetical protein AX16_005465 [Volvariella volvacea WC 439]
MLAVIRIVLFFLFLFATAVSLSLASPINSTTTTESRQNIEKRIVNSGQATWFYPGLGNCGQTDTADRPIVAIAKSRYDRNGGGNCDQWIEITNARTGKKVYGLTRDSCPSCADGDLDLSPSLFTELDGSLDRGRIGITWHFMNRAWHPRSLGSESEHELRADGQGEI